MFFSPFNLNNNNPTAVAKEGSSILSTIPSTSLGNPIWQGRWSSLFTNSSIPGIFAPPPTKTTPAGNNLSLWILFNSFVTNSKISRFLASITSTNSFLEITFPSSPPISSSFISSFLEILSFLAIPYFNFNFSAISMGSWKAIAISLVIWEAPIGKTEEESKLSSSNTESPVDPPPISRTATPNSFWRLESTASEAAKVEKTKSLKDLPVSSMALIKLLI